MSPPGLILQANTQGKGDLLTQCPAQVLENPKGHR